MDPERSPDVRADAGRMSLASRFLRRQDGAMAVEYGLIVALIALAMVGGLSQIDPGFDRIQARIAEALDL